MEITLDGVYAQLYNVRRSNTIYTAQWYIVFYIFMMCISGAHIQAHTHFTRKFAESNNNLHPNPSDCRSELILVCVCVYGMLCLSVHTVYVDLLPLHNANKTVQRYVT